MKVIIMEIAHKEAVALDQNGRFVRIRNLGYRVGQELHISPQMIIGRSSAMASSRITRIAALAACVCLLLGTLFGFLITNSQPYGYVSVDVNPSLEYRIDRFDRVVSVRAVNQDGETLLTAITAQAMEGQDIQVALSLTISELIEQGYLAEEEPHILISSNAKSQRASAALHEKLVAYASQETKLQDVRVTTTSVSAEEVEEASQLGTTAGKLHLIKSLGDEINVSEWIDKSLKDIMTAIGTDEIGTPSLLESDITLPDDATEEPTESAADTEAPTLPSDSETAESLPPATDTETEVPTETATETETDTVTQTTAAETQTEPESETSPVTESETQPEGTVEPETDPVIETDTETEPATEPETETETEAATWPETWPDQSSPQGWPENWPTPDTDEHGNAIWPEDVYIPWWVKLWWSLLFG